MSEDLADLEERIRRNMSPGNKAVDRIMTEYQRVQSSKMVNQPLDVQFKHFYEIWDKTKKSSTWMMAIYEAGVSDYVKRLCSEMREVSYSDGAFDVPKEELAEAAQDYLNYVNGVPEGLWDRYKRWSARYRWKIDLANRWLDLAKYHRGKTLNILIANLKQLAVPAKVPVAVTSPYPYR